MSSDEKLPPVTELGMLSLGFILAAGIYLASHLPEQVPLGPAIALLALSVGTLFVNFFLLSRVKDFDWKRFVWVAKWALLAYCITAGLIWFVFIHNHTRGGPLVVLSLSLVVYAVHVPTLIGFTVARYPET
jgi:hypothetical protein